MTRRIDPTKGKMISINIFVGYWRRWGWLESSENILRLARRVAKLLRPATRQKIDANCQIWTYGMDESKMERLPKMIPFLGVRFRTFIHQAKVEWNCLIQYLFKCTFQDTLINTMTLSSQAERRCWRSAQMNIGEGIAPPPQSPYYPFFMVTHLNYIYFIWQRKIVTDRWLTWWIPKEETDLVWLDAW